MDLIYTNAKREDEGALLEYDLDLAFGSGENDFACKVDYNNHCCGEGCYIYIEGTEYGGIISEIEVDTDLKEITYHGTTWQGMLGEKIIVPLKSGETSASGVTLKTTDAAGASLVNSYLIVSGEANAVIQFILNRIGLAGLFRSSGNSGITISNYQFERYVDAYAGIIDMLKGCNAKLETVFCEGVVNVSAAPVVDYSQDEQFDSDVTPLDIQKNVRPINHLICLGQGDLAEREVIHLYADKNGNISKTQTLKGVDEVTETYDYGSAKSAQDLEANGIKKLKELRSTDKVKIDFDSNNLSYDIGDIVGAKDQLTGISAAEAISKKIVTIKNGETTISYEVGEK